MEPADRRREYVGRINRAIDYVHGHLSGDLRLETVAGVAHFSAYHFHRVFKSLAGETLSDFVRRVRIQKAASCLLHNPGMTITEISSLCGYSSPSAFAREFRSAFDMSASQFRNLRSSGGSAPSGFEKSGDERPPDGLSPRPRNRTEMVFSVDVQERPPFHVAYVRHVGPFSGIGGAFERLFRWAGPRGLAGTVEPGTIAIYHDDPDVTPAGKLRCDACIAVPEGTKVDGEIGSMHVPGGRFAVAHVEIDVSQYAEAWDRLLVDWMPQSGYQPDDRLCYEVYLNDPARHPKGIHHVDICEPIRPL